MHACIHMGTVVVARIHKGPPSFKTDNNSIPNLRHGMFARMLLNSENKRVRLLTIGSVSPMNGGNTQGGVATLHSMINQEFMNKSDLKIDLVGTIATNTSIETDPQTGISYYQRDADESMVECLARVIDLTNPDIIFIHHITNSWAASLSKIENRPHCVGYVHSVNAIDPKINPNHLSTKKMMIKALNVMDILVFNSHHSYERARHLGLNTDCQVHIIPPSAKWEFHKFIVGKNGIRRKILFIGKLDKNKRIIEVMDAMKDHPKYELIISGDGPLKENVLQIIFQSPKCSFTHYENLDSPELAKVLADCGLLCVPSDYESFGLVYIESLCMGVPIIGFGESVKFINSCLELECGVSVNGTIKESIATAIDKLENNYWDPTQLSRKARNFFNPYRNAEGLASLFHSLDDN